MTVHDGPWPNWWQWATTTSPCECSKQTRHSCAGKYSTPGPQVLFVQTACGDVLAGHLSHFFTLPHTGSEGLVQYSGMLFHHFGILSLELSSRIGFHTCPYPPFLAPFFWCSVNHSSRQIHHGGHYRGWTAGATSADPWAIAAVKSRVFLLRYTPFLIFFRWFSGPNFWWNFCGFWTAAWPWCTAFLSFKWDDVLRIRISSTCARRLWTPWKSCLFAGIGGRSTSPVWNHRQTIFPRDILFALKGYEVVEFDGWSFGSGHIMKSHG